MAENGEQEHNHVPDMPAIETTSTTEAELRAIVNRMKQLDALNLLGDLSIGLPLDGPNAGQTFTARIPGSFVWNTYNAFQRLGVMQAIAIHYIDKRLREQLEEHQIPDIEAALDTAWLELGSLLTGGHISPGPDPTLDAVLGFTYRLLRSKTINYNEAARIAGVLLKDSGITGEAWRKRIERYAKDKQPVKARRGRPKKRTN